MAEPKKGNQKTSDNATEKTVHDLTKQEDLTRVLDQSLRALQEMEQRLQLLEQELGSIGARSSQSSIPRSQARSSSGEEYIGAPNPHGFHQPHADPAYAALQQALTGWNPSASAAGARWGAPQQGMQSPFNPAFAQSMPQQVQQPFDPSTPHAQMQQPFAPRPGVSGIGAPSAAYSGMDATTGTPGGTGAPVSEAMQLGEPGMMPEGGTRTKDFSEMTPQVKQPSMDVVDCSSEFLIHWELPGVKKENLDIMVTDKSLILNAKAFPELDDGIVVHSERPPVVYRRTIPFQTEVETAKAKANLKDGVLTIHVPKRSPSSGPKRLDVAYG